MNISPLIPLKLNLSKQTDISYYDMQERLIELGIFKYDKIISDDEERSVCIFSFNDTIFVMKLGNRSDRDDTTKFSLLKKEAIIYKELQNFPEDAKYFPKIIKSGHVNNEFYYIIMEYIKGKTLYDYLNENYRIANFNNSKEILTILLNLTMALNALWSHGIVHGDLSVENVMIEPGLSVKLIDFEKSAKYNPLKLNTVGTSQLDINSKSIEGYGYFFLIRISLSILKNKEEFIPLLHAIKSFIERCDDCTDIYHNCAKIIETEIKKKSGGSKTRATRKALRNKRLKS